MHQIPDLSQLSNCLSEIVLRHLIISLSVLGLTACGTYRTGTGEYHGTGDFKTPSDYAPVGESPEAERTPQASPDANPRESIEGQGYEYHRRLSHKSRYVPQAAFRLSWPVTKVRINRGFTGDRRREHKGVDLGGKRGSPILAAHEGVVIYAGRDFHGYGNMILIEYNKEWATLYGHLDKIARKEGSIVKPGDPIGSMGRTGHATGVHLHFEVLHDKDPVDPIPLLKASEKIAEGQLRYSGS